MAKNPRETQEELQSETDPQSKSADSQKSSRLEELQKQIDELVAERERIKGEGGTGTQSS